MAARSAKTTAATGAANPLEILKKYEGMSFLRIYGLNKYKYVPSEGGLRDLDAAREDGELMEQVLGGTGGFNDVKALYDEEVTKAAIERSLADLAKKYKSVDPKTGKKVAVVGRLYIMPV